MVQKIEEKQLWLTNISTKKDVSIGDLRLTIRRGKSVNILDKRHFSYTEEEIQKSIESGSLYKRKNIIKIRTVQPTVFKNRLIIHKDTNLLRPKRTSVEIEHKVYEDLDEFDFNSEEEILENAMRDFQDNRPALAVDKSFDEDDES